jgi:hypothetical protein
MCHPLLAKGFERVSALNYAIRGHIAAFVRCFGTFWAQNVPTWVDAVLLALAVLLVGVPLSAWFIASIVAPAWAEEMMQKWGPNLDTWSSWKGVAMLLGLVAAICLIEGINSGRQAENLTRLQWKMEDFITMSKTLTQTLH